MLDKLCILASLFAVLCLFLSLWYINDNSIFSYQIFVCGLLPYSLFYLIRAAITGKAWTKAGVDADVDNFPIAFYVHIALYVIVLVAGVGFLIFTLY